MVHLYAHARRRDGRDALAVYDSTRVTGVRFVGFNDVGASSDTLRPLTDRIYEDGRSAILDVVSESADVNSGRSTSGWVWASIF